MSKIMFVTLSLSDGGAERVVSVLSSALAEKGHEVSIVLYGRKPAEYPISSLVNISVIDDFSSVGRIKSLLGKIKWIRNTIKKERPDFVFAFLAQPTIHTYFASLFLKSKFVATVRNNPKLYPKQKALRILCNFVTKKADVIMLQTERQKEFFGAKEQKKIITVHNPVKSEVLISDYEYRKQVKTVGTFGRLNLQKNHKLLISAFSKVCLKNDNLVLKIFGDGEEKENLQCFIDTLNLGEKVFLMGRTENVIEEMQNIDLFVLSSDFEGSPNALIEAMGMGIPCISTDCPTGPADLIENSENGLLVPCGDENKLSDSILQLCSDYDLRKKIGAGARKTIENSYSKYAVVKSLSKQLLGEYV